MKNYVLIKTIVDDLDKGLIMTSLTLKSGKRVISVLLPSYEPVIAELEVGKEAYCLIRGKDIFVFRDIDYFFKNFKTQ
jgi:molybdopterin-binding protein